MTLAAHIFLHDCPLAGHQAFRAPATNAGLRASTVDAAFGLGAAGQVDLGVCAGRFRQVDPAGQLGRGV